MSKKILITSIVLMLCVSNIAVAGREWIITGIEPGGVPVGAPHSAITMRSGSTWPVVSYGSAPSSGTAAMTPVGWMAGPSGGPVVEGVSAATGPGGTAGFANDNGTVLMLKKTGWAASSYGTGTNNTKPSIAFNSDDNPAVLHNTGGGGGVDLTLAVYNGTGWYQDVVENSLDGPYSSDAFALGYDSYNQANIAYADGVDLKFGVKGIMTQDLWEFDTINLSAGSLSIDMAMDANDVPWVTYATMSSLYYATYDLQASAWVNGAIDLSATEYFSMAVDSTGGIGVAFVDAGDTLTFSYNDGGGWVADTGIANVLSVSDVGLAFDADDNPVICYSDSDQAGKLYLAYDPVTIPEPATVILFAIGAAMLRRSKRV